MSYAAILSRRPQPWQLVVCLGVAAFLALGYATDTFRIYHLFLLLAVPGALVAADAGRQFFFDWGPLFGTWITYDRLRLAQPWLLERVGVIWPFEFERVLFGWLVGGATPPHAARAWFAAHAASPLWSSAAWSLEVVYLSHVFAYPALLLGLWLRGRSSQVWRDRFIRFTRAFVVLNLLGFAIYVLLPTAPPWWVSAHGLVQPTAELVASTDLAAGMDGSIIRETIKTAPNWFAAVPSLHGGYPVLLLLLLWRERSRRALAAAAVYGAVMWIATVALNQHYVIDLFAGALVAIVAFRLSERLGSWDAARPANLDPEAPQPLGLGA